MGYFRDVKSVLTIDKFQLWVLGFSEFRVLKSKSVTDDACLGFWDVWVLRFRDLVFWGFGVLGFLHL